jgi:hypothetical protein
MVRTDQEAHPRKCACRFAALHRHARIDRLRNRKAQELLKEFVCHYESLTDAVCSAARHGIREEHNRTYKFSTNWIRRHLGEIGRVMSGKCATGSEPRSAATSPHRPMYRDMLNRLETLVSVETIDRLLCEDDGTLVYKLTRLSELIYSSLA